MTPNESWASFMLGLVCAYRRPAGDGVALAAHMSSLLPTCGRVFYGLGASKATVTQMLATIKRGKAPGRDGMPSLPYAALLLALRKQLRSDLPDFYVRPDVSERLARCVRATVALLTPDTATVARKDAALDKMLGALPDPVVRTAFAPVVEHDQRLHLKEAAVLVRRMVGASRPALEPTETKSAKERHPDTYRQYLAVRRNVTAAYQGFVRSAVRANGGPVPIGATIKSMRQGGIDYHPYHGLEKLYLGEDPKGPGIKLFTAKPHRPINASVAPGSKLVLNPRYDPRTDDTYVFKYQVPGSKRDAGDLSAAYTSTYARGRKAERMELVVNTARQMPQLRPRWLRDLKSTDSTTRRLAAMTEMLYSLAMRIGGKGNRVDDVETYGLSTLLVNHVVIRNGTAALQYPGKDAIQQRHVLRGVDATFPENALVLKILMDAVKGKRGNMPVWTDARGSAISSGDVRAYMKGKKLPIGPHKFRHIRGTELMEQLLSKAKVPAGAKQAAVEKLVKQTAIHVGELLGHVSGERATAATSIKNYIHPEVIAKFFRERDLRIPSWVPKAGQAGLGDEA